MVQLHSKNERFFGDLKQVFQLAPYREPIFGSLKNLIARFHEKPIRDFQTVNGFTNELKVLAKLWIEPAPSSFFVRNTVNRAIQETYFAVIKRVMYSCLLCYE